jgi:hypothetical protein
MSNADGYADAEDYFSDFRDQLERQLPEEYPGSRAIRKLLGEYVARDKRSVLIVVRTGPTTALSVHYKMPVPANGASIFGLEGLVPHEPPVFGMLAIPEIPERVAAAAVAPWDTEVARVQGVEATGDTPKLRRAAHNVLVYWRLMQRLLHRVYADLGIIGQQASTQRRTTTRSSNGTDPRMSTPRPNSDPAVRRTSTLSAPSSKRSSSKRRTSSRRRSAPARVGPRRFSGKLTSDPTRTRRKRTA